jgi:hypothetical protein
MSTRFVRRRSWRWPNARDLGQSMVEYLLIVVLVMLGLFLPIGGNPPVAEQLASAIVSFFQGFSFLVALE